MDDDGGKQGSKAIFLAWIAYPVLRVLIEGPVKR